MHLEKLFLIQFKNYQELEIFPSTKINYFIGNNGVGKTNILDAIYYLSMTKSYFNSSDIQNIKHESDFFVIQGEFSNEEQLEKIYCGVKKNQKKRLKRNDKDYDKIANHIGLIPIVIISPSDTVLISGSADERRKYMDSVISQYDKEYLFQLISYKKVLAQRNTLLKDAAKAHFLDRTILEYYDEQLSIQGMSIFEKRKKFISRLEEIFNVYYNEISGGKEKVFLGYKSQLFESDLRSLLKDKFNQDSILQHTSVGIHRDDITLQLGDYPIRKIGSQGQQKSFLVALKFAQFDFFKEVNNKRPILLLDDIFDKLDFHRVKNIIKLVVDKHFGQIFITDTDAQRAKDVLSEINQESKIFYIENGKIKKDEKE